MFVDEEIIYDVYERLMKRAFKEVLDYDLQIPFKRIPYKESMEKYNSDKPDLRPETGEKYAFCWVTEFPMFEFSEEENKYVPAHHPFTQPHPDDLPILHSDKPKVRSRAYDLVLNGFELGSGSIRIHDKDLQSEVFRAIGLDHEQQQNKFGFMLEALQYAPPHGGFAIGTDRVAMIMAGAENIREVIAFPKNNNAYDLMMNAPSKVQKDQLDLVHIDLAKGKEHRG